jgi:signal peptidase II
VAWARALAIAAVVVIVDRVTKHLVVAGIPVGDVRRVLPGLELVHDRNSGVAFSFFAGGGLPVLALTAVALLAMLAYFGSHAGRPGLWIPTGLLLGGALGNLIDRLASGSVTDFIQLPHWPAFNVSDMAITIGVVVLVLLAEGPRRRRAPGGG